LNFLQSKSEKKYSLYIVSVRVFWKKYVIIYLIMRKNFKGGLFYNQYPIRDNNR